MTAPGPTITSGGDTQPGADSLFPTGFGGGGASVRPGGVGTGEILDGSIAAADVNLASVGAALAAHSTFTGAYTKLLSTDAVSTSASGTLVAWHLTPVDATSAPATWTLPAANSVVSGVEVAVKKADTSANTVIVSRAGSDLIFGTGSGATSKTLTLAGEAVTLVSDGVSKWTIQTSDTPSGVLASTYLTQTAATSTYVQAVLPEKYGAKGDGRTVTDAAITTSTALLSSVSAVFTIADVGKQVWVKGAGSALSGPPAIGTITNATTGGFVSGGTTVAYRVSALGPVGETLAGTEVTFSVPAGTSTNVVTVPWSAVTGATGYNVYGRSSGSELLIAQVGADVLSFVDYGVVTPAGALPASATAKNHLLTTIGSVSAGVATLAATAGTTVSGATCVYGTDDTTALNSALAVGGAVQLGAKNYITTGGLTASSQTAVRGVGGGTNRLTLTALSQITCMSPTAAALTLAAHGSSVADLGVACVAATVPTAGAGIAVTAGDFTRLRNVDVRGFWVNIDIQTGWYWKMTDCTLVGPVKYGLQCQNTANQDLGDSSIVGCNILAAKYRAEAGIRYVGGGGFKMVNTKINAVDGADSVYSRYGLRIDIPAGMTTGQFEVANCSIENWDTHAVYYTTAGGSFGNIYFSALQTGSYTLTAREALNIQGGGSTSGFVIKTLASQRLPFTSGGHGFPQVTIDNVSGIDLSGLRPYGYRANHVKITNSVGRRIDPIRVEVAGTNAGNYTDNSAAWAYIDSTNFQRYTNANIGDVMLMEMALVVDPGATNVTAHFGFMIQGTSNTTVEAAQVIETTANAKYTVLARYSRTITANDIRTDGQVRVLGLYYKSTGTIAVVNTGGVVPLLTIHNIGDLQAS